MNKSYVIAVIGSGGKTSMIERLAAAAWKAGKKTAVMTTTHMWLPREHSTAGKEICEAERMLDEEGITVFGSLGEGKARGKLTYPGQDAYEQICRMADLVLVEADGSRNLPMKFPEWPREPVVPANTDAVFVMFGLSAVGQPLETVCHRWQLGLLRADGAPAEEDGRVPVTPEMAADFLERGYLRPIRFRLPSAPLMLFFNQADTTYRKHAGEKICGILQEKGWECRLCRLRPARIALIYMASGFGNRFGENKLLKLYEGKPLYRHGLDMFLELKRELEAEEIHLEIIVVSQYPEILREGRNLEEGQSVRWDLPGFWTVKNDRAAEGITSSIHLGVLAAGEEADGYLFSVADQPRLSVRTMKNFLKNYQENLIPGKKDMGCLSWGGRRGNPVLFYRTYREKLLALTGDRGGSRIMKEFPGRVMEFPAGEEELKDIDYPENMR